MSALAVPVGTRAGSLSRAGRRRPSRGMTWALASLLVLGLVLALRTWVVTPFQVVSDSMAPTLPEGSTVLVDRLTLRWDGPGYQELVLFDSPDGPVVKRVVGLPGDTVRIYDAVLHVNGTPVEEPYVDLRTLDGVFFGPVEVGAGEVFVLGDNRFDSIDSRTYGPIALEAVTGRVISP
ncbi:signal peptidase I [Ornithinimicrobium cerasi]|uniref:Signal peptidase I n=1 Tax=Ornithinimicrobium cerasi TaxID=2248773 RepID=A0A285VCY4_9MICO|nr:signal peptidase I [Ornithinimicrobium cerasi]SOC51985.1 signal peptidase I [Ornithinimicrobium cerasi]